VPHKERRAVSRPAQSELGHVVAEPTRRLVLAAAAAGSLTLAGCKGITALGPVPKPGTAVLTLEHTIAAEELMIARYEAAVTALAGAGDGSVTARQAASAILAEHQAHLAQLRALLILPARLATASPRPSPTPPPLPAGRHRILAELAAAETAASDRLISGLAAVPPGLAQLMASVAASEAAHVVLLGHPGGAR